MSPRTKQAFGRLRQERIDQINRVAYRVFSDKGFSATMIEDIAKEAGISKGLIYHYYRSKDELFIKLVGRAMQGALELVETAKVHPGSPLERLGWLVTEIITRARQNREEFLIIVQAYTTCAAPQKARSMALEYLAAISRSLGEMIKEGQESGQIVSGDAGKIAMTVTACLQGLVLSVVLPTGEGSDGLDVSAVLRILEP